MSNEIAEGPAEVANELNSKLVTSILYPVLALIVKLKFFDPACVVDV